MDDAPVIVVDGTQVLVSGHVVDDVAAIARSHRIQRLDGLFERLKRDKAAWMRAHPGAPFPGECNLALDQGTPAAVVKSVFETAAFAGYPFTGFVVQKDGGGLGVLATDAQVPCAGAGRKA
jgi:hypothetical protein